MRPRILLRIELDYLFTTSAAGRDKRRGGAAPLVTAPPRLRVLAADAKYLPLSGTRILGVKPCGTRLRIRKGVSGTVRLPKILVVQRRLVLAFRRQVPGVVDRYVGGAGGRGA